MALSDDLRKRVVEAVISGGLSHNAAAKRFEVSISGAVRWVKQFETTGEISPKPSGGDRRSGRIEAHHDNLTGLIRRTPDITLFEIQVLVSHVSCLSRVPGSAKAGQSGQCPVMSRLSRSGALRFTNPIDAIGNSQSRRRFRTQ
jgi:hypothetical protein